MSSEELKAAAAAEAELAAADEASKPKAAEEKAKKPRRKENKKRIRRVGKSEPRKMLKEDDSKAEPKVDAVVGEDGPIEIRRVVSKHDEKWNDMFGKLLAFKVSIGWFYRHCLLCVMNAALSNRFCFLFIPAITERAQSHFGAAVLQG